MRQAADRREPFDGIWAMTWGSLCRIIPPEVEIRTRYGLDVFRRFFDAIVEQCQRAKLVWGKELSIDSTQVNANADLDSLTPRFAVEAREAIQQHLSALFAQETPQQESPEETSKEAPASEPLPESTACQPPTPLPVVLVFGTARRTLRSQYGTA
jgi:hypothetical protein